MLPDWMKHRPDRHFASQSVRACEVTSSQFHQYGWWHTFYVANENGPGERVYALVEIQSGSVERYEVSGCYSIKFLDGESK